MKRRNFINISILAALSNTIISQAVMGQAVEENRTEWEKTLTDSSVSPWEEGMLDIHQINTGRGNSTFIIFPDGTTMLIDAGDLGSTRGLSQKIMPACPDATCLPGEWIARYIKKFLPVRNSSNDLDYVLLTHFHTDHIGYSTTDSKHSKNGNYALAGVTEVAEHLKIGKIIDRGWPSYDYPSKGLVKKAAGSHFNFDNYLSFLEWQIQNRDLRVEHFDVGSQNQIKPLYKTFSNYKVQNIYCNGALWMGDGHLTKALFPEISTLEPKDYPNENQCSCVIKISYGNFDYYSGGDITGVISPNTPRWKDVETPVGEVVGPVDAALLNHHGYSDSQNDNFIKYIQPKIWIIPVWDFYHPQPEVLERICNKNNYPLERKIYATGLVKENEERLGALADQIEKPTGHILLRVYDGGDKFRVFSVSDESKDYFIKSISSYFYSK